MRIRNSVISLLLSVCLCGTPVSVNAVREGNLCGDSLTWDYDGDGLLTVSGTGEMWDFFFFDGGDEAYDGIPPWSAYQNEIRTIRIGEGVTGIGQAAFSGCRQLTDAVLPSTLSCIGECAFYSTGLQTIELPQGLTEIKDNAFSETELTEICIPSSVRTLGFGAFRYNFQLKKVRLEEGLTEIGSACFACCPLLDDISFPDSLQKAGTEMMQGDTAWYRLHADDELLMLNSSYLYRYYRNDGNVVIPETVRHIHSECFFDPFESSVRNENPRFEIKSVILPDSLTELPEQLFMYCQEMKLLHIGSGVKAIPARLCADCDCLETVELPDGLRTIGDEAFSGCVSLQNIRIPDSIEEIGEDAFRSCPFLAESGDWVICGDSLLLRYQGTDRVVTVPEGVRTVCSDAFRDSAAVSVTLSSSVRKLCRNSFRSELLLELTLNDGLTALPYGVLECSHLFRQLTVPESVTDINPYCCAPDMVFTVTGEKGSAAELFAGQAHLPFRQTGSFPEGKDMTLDLETDCWSFRNAADVFGEQNYLTDADRALLSEYGLTAGQSWSGACFGMCAAVILAKNGIFSADQISCGADSISALKASPAVQSIINYYHCLQKTDAFMQSRNGESFEQCVYRMIRTAEMIPHGESPFMICIETDEGRHAVIGNGTETGCWEYRGRVWEHRISVYDPNIAGCSDDCCFYYDPVTLAVCVPEYGFFWDCTDSGNWHYLRACSSIGVLNACPYPFAERFAPDGLLGDLSGDGLLSAADAELLLDYLLCRAELSAAQRRCADLSGDGILTAADLSMLKRKLLVRRAIPASA